jgi:DNA polymerase III subunit gamma/tau
VALALYRKYRPRTFAEVIGQEHVTEPLSQALRSGRLHHAYLFSGPRGCGKTSSARILARSLNCVRGPTPDPCGECESCRSLANEGAGSIDVIEIDAASHGGVDDARELRERAFFAPVSSRYKIYVIDEAHMVSPAGFNALLKLVEEPPDYVTFIFATTEPEKVLGTIKSRTHHYPFRLIPPGVLRPYLEKLCEEEGVAVEPAVFPLVVRAGAGSVRDALSVLDQLIAGAGPEGVTYRYAVALLGVTDVTLIDEMCDALAAGDGAAAYATIDRVAEAGHDPRRFASDLLERLRDLIVLQQVPDAVTKGLLDAPADQLDRMARQAQRIGPATLSRYADIVHNGLVEMRGTTAPRLLLELISARMLLPGAEDSDGALLQRLERMERRLTLSDGAATAPPAPDADPGVRPDRPSAPAPPAPLSPASAGPPSAPPGPAELPPAQPVPPRPPRLAAPAGPAAPARGVEEPTVATAPPTTAAAATAPPTTAAPATAPPAGVPGRLDAAGVRRVWDEVLTQVARKSKRAAAVVREATVRDVDGDTLVLVFRHSVHANMLAASPERLLDALHEVLGGSWEIRCEVGGDARAGSQGGGFRPAAPMIGAAPTRPGPSGVAAAGPARSAVTVAGGAAVSAAGGAAGGGDWPEPARPGGSGAATEPVGKAPSARPPLPRARADAPARGNGGRRRRGGSSGGEPAGRTEAARGEARPADGAWDGAAADEPPYDPDFDGSTAGRVGRRHVGFDPGDEPLDDAGDASTRQTSEQQALQLLQQQLGAEKIGETDAR